MSERCKPKSKDEIIERAKLLSDLPPVERFPKITDLLADSRAILQGKYDEVFKAAGYGNINNYWRAELSKKMPVSRYAHILAIHHIDPKEKPGKIRRHSATAYQEIHNALRSAWDEDKEWILGPYLDDIYGDDEARNYEVNEEGWRGMFLMPRKATEWLLDNAIYADLVPASLQALLRPEATAALNTNKGGRPPLWRSDEFARWCEGELKKNPTISNTTLGVLYCKENDLPQKVADTLRKIVRKVKKQLAG